MKFPGTGFCLLFSSATRAHHTRDHMIILQDSTQVIAATEQGSDGGMFWLLWAGTGILLVLGIVRWWKNRT